MNEIDELRKYCSFTDEPKELYLDLYHKYRQARDNMGVIKNFDQLKKIVDFPANQKLHWTHTMFFADSSVGDGVEFLKLFDDESKIEILTTSVPVRVFKPGAFSFDNRADIEKFLKEECKFEVSKINFISYFIAVIVDLAMMMFAIIRLVFFVFAYVPMRMCGEESFAVKYTFAKRTRLVMACAQLFNVAIKSIENNCAAGKQQQPNKLSNWIEISNLGQTILIPIPKNDSLENNGYGGYPTFNSSENDNNQQLDLPTLEEIEEIEEECARRNGQN